MKGTDVNELTIEKAIVNYSKSSDELTIQLGHSGVFRKSLKKPPTQLEFYSDILAKGNKALKASNLSQVTFKTIQNKERIGVIVLTMGSKKLRAEFEKEVRASEKAYDIAVKAGKGHVVTRLCSSLSSYANFLNPKAKEVKKGHQKASNGSNMTLTAKVGKSISTLVISKDLIVASAQLADLQNQLAELVKTAQSVKA